MDLRSKWWIQGFLNISAPRLRLLVSMYVYSYQWNKDPSVLTKKLQGFCFYKTNKIKQSQNSNKNATEC